MVTCSVHKHVLPLCLSLLVVLPSCGALWGFDPLSGEDATRPEGQPAVDAGSLHDTGAALDGATAADADDRDRRCSSTPVCTPGATCRTGCATLTCDDCGLWPGTCGGVCTLTFDYTGASQSLIVPADVGSVKINATGASGGSDCNGVAGGLGVTVAATLPVTPGETLAIYVGGMGGKSSGTGNCASPGPAGFNGGGPGGTASIYSGAGGGGASDVRRGGVSDTNRVIVAAGGGGGGGGGGGAGGRGGIDGAGNVGLGIGGGGGGGDAAGVGPGGGGGGGAASGGVAGPAGASGGTAGVAGGQAVGGAGGGGDYQAGGGGGGGYFGGGGGGGKGNYTGDGGAGGGGGSSLVASPAVKETMQPAAAAGHGRVVVSY